MNFKDLFRNSKAELMLDLPKLGKIEQVVCGPYQLGKQIMTQYRKIKSINTYIS